MRLSDLFSPGWDCRSMSGRAWRASPTARMLPAKGPVRHRIAGTGEPLQLLVLGDSSSAGVGVDLSEEGLASQLAGRLGQLTGRPVIWRSAGFNSATSGQIRDHVLPNLSADPWTHIVITLGTNDAKNFHTTRRFKKEFGGLLYALRAKWPEARWSGRPWSRCRLFRRCRRCSGESSRCGPV